MRHICDLHQIKMKRKYSKILFIIVLTGLNYCVGAPTTRPLEHSPSELAWDAWLKQGHPPDVMPPRRITTKSLFIFPNLGADSLPACAEGYRPDAMGRCVKVVKVNESAHLEFLLQKLNSQFADDSGSGSEEFYDYDIDPDPSDGSGPLQINIPLALHNTGHKTVHKSDENQQGEYVVVSKKDPPLKSGESAFKLPASSPEVVPNYMNENPQFFPGGPPAEPQDVLPKNNSSSTGGVSILIRNSTNVGLTVLMPTNGKVEKVSEHKDEMGENMERKGIQTTTETIMDESTEINTENDAILTTTPDVISVTELQTSIEETSHKKQSVSSNLKQEHVNNKKDELIDEIESLKIKPEIVSDTSYHQHHHHSNNHQRIKPHHYENQRLPTIDEKYKNDRPKDIDIEEKIKIISKFADVSRNAEDLKDYERPTNYVRFPEERVHEYISYEKPTNLLPVPSMPVHLPVNSHGMPIPQNSVYNVHQVADNYEKFQPIQFDEEKYKPQWLPYGWNVHGTSSGEQNLIDFWSRLSMTQRYPYNVKLHQEPRSTHYPTLYPNSRESGSRLNIRHNSGNYRQGRENNNMLRSRRPYQDESMSYKRNLNSHFRNPIGYSRTLQAYNGR